MKDENRPDSRPPKGDDAENSRNSRRAQHRPAGARHRAIRLITLAELCAAWKVTDRKVYGAIERNELHPAARPGKQPYYLLNEVVGLWGEPVNPDALKVIQVEFGRDKATYPRGSEFVLGA